MDNNKFIDGLYLNPVSPKAPDFIKCNVAIDVQRLTAWLLANPTAGKDGKLRLVGKESKEGKLYFQIDDYQKPDAPADATVSAEDIPF